MNTCSSRARRNLASQGFSPIVDDCEAAALARAARFQPRVTLALLSIGIALVASGSVTTAFAAAWFGTLAALAWFGVAKPASNVFDIGWRLVATALPESPAPRRFSQGIASVFLTTIAMLFFAGSTTAAFVVAGVMAVAASLAAFGDVCIGSELYNLVVRRPGMAV